MLVITPCEHRFQSQTSRGLSASPSSQPTRLPQHGTLHAEHSSASVGMPASAPPHSTPPHASPCHDSQAGQGFSALYHRSEGSQQASHGASEPAGAGVHVGSWTQQEEGGQPGSPTAGPSSVQAGGGDTPKTLQLKALAAQAERLKQVGLVAYLHSEAGRKHQHTRLQLHHSHCRLVNIMRACQRGKACLL